MTKEEQLREIQKRIAEARGYTDVRDDEYHNVEKDGRLTRALTGVLHADEGLTLIPRWPMDWCDAGVLVEEFRSAPGSWGYNIDCEPRRNGGVEGREYEVTVYGKGTGVFFGTGDSAEEAIARCWCAFKGIDLSDIQ